MNTLDAAVHRVVNIWDCPVCGAYSGKWCTSGELHLQRLPVHFAPDEMVRTTLTEQWIERILTEQPCRCIHCRKALKKARLAA